MVIDLAQQPGSNTGNNDTVLTALGIKASSTQFCEYINNRILEHINTDSINKKPYIFLTGFGAMFPFLRTSAFLTAFEKFNNTSKYKIIIFYPGVSEGNSFSLFGLLNDHSTYRAIKLIND